MRYIFRPALDFLRWDLRATLAVILALAVLVGWSLAQTPLYVFDFGTASGSELASGAIHVKGALTTYPTVGVKLTYGWQTTAVQEFSNKNVSDLLNRDYNGSSGANQFKISGLEAGVYDVKFVVGDPANKLATRIQLGAQAVDVVADKKIRSVVLTHEVKSGDMSIGFSSADGATNWGVNAISITPDTGGAPQPSFKMSLTPATQTIKAGGVAAYMVGLTPIDNYAAKVNLSISGLVSGIAAEFVPAQITAAGSSELRLKTSGGTAPTTYEFLVTATGADDANVVQNGIVKLIVRSGGTSLPVDGEDVIDDSTTLPDEDEIEASIPSRTEAEVKQDFAQVDEFVEEYQEKVIAQKKDIKFIEGISAELYGVPILPELPAAKTPFETALQNLVQSGLIQSTIDNAPPAPTEPTYDQESWWQRFKKTLFPPAF
ncbi:MAG: hypothetical protein PHR51_02550 [Patescibacteria group bacterium]|nr:hypothetical protein [Patescibacteria group bacterium]